MRLGVIDIGQNAVRASVYDKNTLGAPEIFNKKFKSDIHNLIIQNNELNPKNQTYLAIQYILYIFKQLKVSKIYCVATALLRNYDNATLLTNLLENHFDININVISGEEEARLTAIGLISGIQNVDGVMADLGGGSLELVHIENHNIYKKKSLNLGTDIMREQKLSDRDTIINMIRDEFGDLNYSNLYLVGGALRFIGKVYIKMSHYPLDNLHNLTIAGDELLYYLNKIYNDHEQGNTKNIVKKVNLQAIILLQALIKLFQPDNIVISNFGLKEGVRFTLLDKEEQNKDLLYEKVKYSVNYDDRNVHFNDYLDILRTITPESANISDLFKLSIMFTSIVKYFDHTMPYDALFEIILSSEIPFTHKMRIMLILISEYTFILKPNPYYIKLSQKLLSKKEHHLCKIIGHFIHIIHEIDGPILSKPSFKIEYQDSFLEIKTDAILPRTIFTKVKDNIKAIAFANKIER